MKVRHAKYCNNCYEVFSQARKCPACGSAAIIPLQKIMMQCVRMLDLIRGEIVRAQK